MTPPFTTTIHVPGTTVELCRLGLGCARLFAGSEARASARILEAALEAGVRHFDTAPVYSYGQSEEIVGEVLAGMPEVTITTKVGIHPPPPPRPGLGSLYRRYARPVLARLPRLKALLLKRARPVEDESPRPPRVLGRDELLMSVERSLKKLRRDALDVLVLHEPDYLVVDDALRAELESLQASGVVRAFGLGLERTVEDFAPFGQVLQCRYDPRSHRPDAVPVTRIFHGVLRHSAEDAQAIGAGQRVRAALEAWPQATVIFSASAPSQIRDVARGCFGR